MRTARRSAAGACLFAGTLVVLGCGPAPMVVSSQPSVPTTAGVEHHGGAAAPPTTAAGSAPPAVAAAPPSVADLRFSFEPLLGHHATLVTRLMRTRLAGSGDVVEAANQALVLNTRDLVQVIASVHGGAAGEEFGAVWTTHTDLLFDYTSALAAGDQPGRDGARAGLDQYRAQYGALVERVTSGGITAQQAADDLRVHIDHLLGFADAYHAGDFGRAYGLQREAFAHMFPTGRALSGGLVNRPGELPVVVDDPSQQLRSTLGLLLGEHFELMVDTMRAAVTGAPEFTGAAAALEGNKTELTRAMDALVGAEQAAQFNQAWASHIELLVRYSVAVTDDDEGAREAARRELAVAREHIAASFSALTGGALAIDAATAALSPHDDVLTQQVDAYGAQDYGRAHQLAFEGYQHMFATAAALAPAIEAHVASRAPVGPAQTGGGGMAKVVLG